MLTCCHCQLLEILELEHEGHEMKIPIKEKGAPKCFMNMENLSNCFKAVAKLTPPLEHRGIAASDFAHGSTKLVASFVWRLMKRYDEPRSDIEIIKWYAARVKPFDIIIDIDEPIPATLPGVPFQALIESQHEGTYDIPGLNGVSNEAVSLLLLQTASLCPPGWGNEAVSLLLLQTASLPPHALPCSFLFPHLLS